MLLYVPSEKLIDWLSGSNLKIERATQSILTGYNITLPQFGVMEVLYHLGDLKICESIEKILSTSGNMTTGDGFDAISTIKFQASENSHVLLIEMKDK